MTLNINSLNSKLYRWFYCIGVEDLPNNLCKYFWKLILAWILIIPYGLFCLLYIITCETFNSNYKKVMENRLIFSFILNLMLVLFTMTTIMLMRVFSEEKFNSFYVIALITVCVISWFVICYILNFIVFVSYEKIKKVSYHPRIKPKKVNILKEFIKAKYFNYCPKINWEKKQKS